MSLGMRWSLWPGWRGLLVGLCLVSTGCAVARSASPEVFSEASPGDRVELIFDDLVGASVENRGAIDAVVDAPRNVRPCCAFGYDLKVGMGVVPVPGFKVGNLIDPARIGRHSYDPSLVSVENAASGFLSGEVNGMTYSCRGGFIDLAHVRDYADWTFFLATEMESLLDTGGVLELPDEAGQRFVYLVAPGEGMVQHIGRRELAVALAQWIAFQLSIWHETATWYGWSTWRAFPEEASAFSPEDLYSNLIGIKIAGEILSVGTVVGKRQFNRNMDYAIETVLKRLGAMPAPGTRQAADAIDGLWWDSRARLPNKGLVLRRNFDIGPLIVPWRVPKHRMTRGLEEAMRSYCGRMSSAAPLVVRDSVAGVPLSALARLDVRIDSGIQSRMMSAEAGSFWVDQRDIARLVGRAREENRREFGVAADRAN